MRLLSKSSAADVFGTLVAVGVNALIVYALTDIGLWASLFLGYVLVEVFVTSSRLKSAAEEIEETNAKLDAANLRIDLLNARLENLSRSVLS